MTGREEAPMRFTWVILLTLTLAAARAAASYHVAATLKIGGEGRWDYLVASSGRLYVPRSSHTTVLDAGNGKTLLDVPDTDGVHGVALVSRLHRAFTSNGKDGTTTIIDTAGLRVLGKVRTAKGVDCIVDDSASHRC